MAMQEAEKKQSGYLPDLLFGFVQGGSLLMAVGAHKEGMSDKTGIDLIAAERERQIFDRLQRMEQASA